MPVKLLVRPAQIVPFIAFGGRMNGLACLLVSLPLQQQAGSTELVGQMFGRGFAVGHGTAVFVGFGNVGEFGEVFV